MSAAERIAVLTSLIFAAGVVHIGLMVPPWTNCYIPNRQPIGIKQGCTPSRASWVNFLSCERPTIRTSDYASTAPADSIAAAALPATMQSRNVRRFRERGSSRQNISLLANGRIPLDE